MPVEWRGFTPVISLHAMSFPVAIYSPPSLTFSCPHSLFTGGSLSITTMSSSELFVPGGGGVTWVFNGHPLTNRCMRRQNYGAGRGGQLPPYNMTGSLKSNYYNLYLLILHFHIIIIDINYPGKIIK